MCGGGEGEREREGGGERGARGLLYTHISGWSRVADALSRPALVQPGSLCAHSLNWPQRPPPSSHPFPSSLSLSPSPNGIEYVYGWNKITTYGIE